MDHAEVREALEIAAVEPGGLERLMAGDTPEAVLVATHLAGCDVCARELERLRRVAPVLRQAIAETPDPSLRERTLARVRELGRPRLAAEATPRPVPTGATPLPNATAPGRGAASPTPLPSSGSVPASSRLARRRLAMPAAWVASLAAAVVLGVAVSSLLLSGDRNALQRQQAAVTGLADVATTTARLLEQADVHRVELVDATGKPAGLLLVSRSSGDLVMETAALTAPAADQEYRCWVEMGGVRRQIGWMEFGGGLAYWSGRVSGLAALGGGATFGVSLVPRAYSGSTAPAALTGTY